jgi:hypothetical protein
LVQIEGSGGKNVSLSSKHLIMLTGDLIISL